MASTVIAWVFHRDSQVLARRKGRDALVTSSTLQDIIQVKEGLLVIKLINVIHCGLPSSLRALSAACTMLLSVTLNASR